MTDTRKKKKRHFHFVLFLLLLLLGVSVAFVIFLLQRNMTATFTPVTFEESNENLQSPYMGWYHTYSYVIEASDSSQDGQETNTAALDLTKTLEEDNLTRLCRIKIDLSNYRNQALDENALSQIRGILSAWSATDKQIILSFSYDAYTSTPATGEEEITMIYRHLEQVSNVINSFSTSIYLLDGDMTSFASMDGAGYTELISYMASLTDTSIRIGLADSANYLLVTEKSDIPEKKQIAPDSLMARLGIFNKSLTSEASQAQINYNAKIASIAPVGGTISLDQTLLDENAAISFLKENKIAFLDGDGVSTILEGWKNTPYQGEDAYKGLTLYDYMTTHLGYRYLISDATFSFDAWADDSGELTLSIKNVGFSPAYDLLDVSLLLRNDDTEEVINLALDEDNRLWEAGDETKVTAKLDLRDYAKGDYTVYFLLRNPATGEIIKLADTIPLTSNGYGIGTLTLN